MPGEAPVHDAAAAEREAPALRQVLALMVVIVVAVVLGAAWIWPLGEVEKDIGVIRDVLGIVALLVGAYWAYRKFDLGREDHLKAETAHKVTHRKLARERRFLRIEVNVRNRSKRLLPMHEDIILYIQQVDPPDKEIFEILERRQAMAMAGKEVAIDPTAGDVALQSSFVPWGLIGRMRKRWDSASAIEPDASESEYFDFVINEEVEMIVVHSFLYKPGNTEMGPAGIGWQKQTVHILDDRFPNAEHPNGRHQGNNPHQAAETTG